MKKSPVEFRVFHQGKLKFYTFDSPSNANLIEGVFFDALPWNENESGVLMQWTGTKDFRGKKVFEGDFITIIHKSGVKEGPYIVKLLDFPFGWVLDRQVEDRVYFQDHAATSLAEKLYGCEIEVIGNKFENPGLLPAKTE